jgi:Zn finger protein HypA/HybF involved in hydrogenase expression
MPRPAIACMKCGRPILLVGSAVYLENEVRVLCPFCQTPQIIEGREYKNKELESWNKFSQGKSV